MKLCLSGHISALNRRGDELGGSPVTNEARPNAKPRAFCIRRKRLSTDGQMLTFPQRGTKLNSFLGDWSHETDLTGEGSGKLHAAHGNPVLSDQYRASQRYPARCFE